MICLVPALMLGQEFFGQQQGVLHVGAQDVLVPLQVRQVVGFEFLGVGGEADDVETVPRVLGGDQIVQRQGHFLGGLERTAQGHGPGQIYQHCGGGGGDQLAAIDLEIFRLQTHRRFRAFAVQGVADGAGQVQVKGVAELVGLGVLEALAETTFFGHRVIAHVLALQALVDFAQRLLADHA